MRKKYTTPIANCYVQIHLKFSRIFNTSSSDTNYYMITSNSHIPTIHISHIPPYATRDAFVSPPRRSPTSTCGLSAAYVAGLNDASSGEGIRRGVFRSRGHEKVPATGLSLAAGIQTPPPGVLRNARTAPIK